MKIKLLNGAGLASVLPALMLATGVPMAQAEEAAAGAADAADEDEIRRSANDIVVLGNIGYRNRSEATEPTLVYDTEYFQRFEPLTAGDALKRVPSVTFLSDVIESDGVRLRGLAPAYTQILINGERVPGSSADRSFFMDRIPAELIDRVEIVRSSSARRTADAMAGTLNIVLRDGLQLDGGYVRVGGLSYDDNELEPSLGFVYGGQVGPGRLLLGLNLQGRHNPKRKQSLRFENAEDPITDEPTNVPAFDNREDQRDTRDGKDYSANASYTIESGTTKFVLDGFYVKTDRTETERSREYKSLTAFSGPINEGGALTADNSNIANIDQENFTVSAKLSHEWSLGKTSLKAGFARFDEDRRETENEVGFDEDDGAEFEGERTLTRIKDEELSFKLEHEAPITDGIKLVFGGFWQDKDRKTDINKADADAVGGIGGLLVRWDQFSRNPDSLVAGYDDVEYDPGNLNRIREQRRDGFALLEGKAGSLHWEAGVRYEHTDVKIDNLTPDDDAAPSSLKNSYDFWLPSASLRFDVTPRDRITASVARTVRRPDFNYVTPATLEGELGDNDLRGDPFLKPESAWGFDLGYEHRIGATGVIGINAFYRDVSNLIELYNTREEGDEGPGSFVYQPRNIGKGKVYGIEFDMSTSLSFIGLPHTGLFGNFSWLDSEVTDEFGGRRFNGQSKYVYNFGAIQDFPNAGVAMGATYRKQADAFDRTVGEEVVTNYGADLEIFVEKRFGKSFTVRAVGSNLLNGRKNETFNKFNTIEEQNKRQFDEYELESEQAGPVFQIMARLAF